MSVEFNIEGLDEVQEKLKRLANPRLMKNAARRSMRKAMAIVRDAARSGAKNIDDPQTAEKIWKNIAIAAGKTRNPNEVIMRVGVRGGASFSNPNPPKTSGGDTRHWRWIEFGASHFPPTPFMRPALQNNIQSVTNSFAENFNKEIDKELAKL
ncbi:HK97-gp10 family putative phage morphogenesis protein [Acinetobacter pseudolwoffii]|uniref:HK97-gp10 family putative phage morphogenesis protein n=1 Tax=Acinetobacter pseudolwoffii TaxID=2053287 RepID=UPI002469356F|nr:HK97-gp10 family putative phage morphogenesis protein [Acinetobacter pseudolwoffii]MDH5819503.1 HK97 gp10 family phage protein [Acinetobacter pseudolwoffii]